MNDRIGLQLGGFTLDVTERLLLRDGHPVSLTPMAFDVLASRRFPFGSFSAGNERSTANDECFLAALTLGSAAWHSSQHE
jgi:hypothetical protein